jgi:biotin carboxyl carrier protein
MEKVLKTWLFTQCRLLSGCRHGLLLTGSADNETYDRVIRWPDTAGDAAALSPVVQAALRNKKAAVTTRNNQVENTGEPLDALACPLFVGDRLMGVVAIELTHRSQAMQRLAVEQVQSGARWLECMLHLHGATASEQLIHLVELVAAGLEHDSFAIAATEVANTLAERFGCHRVSLGFMRGHRVRVEAMSHTRRVDRQSNRVRALQDAMGECLDQGASVVYPATADDSVQVTRFHAQLADDRHGAAICTLPLVKNAKVVGALLLERDAGSPFEAETVARCEQIGLMLGPVLENRRREERALPVKVFDSLRSGLGKLFGPRHLTLKSGVGLAVMLMVALSLFSTTMRISCDAVLEASVRRAVVAPQKGYIAKAYARAGDRVGKGELLATLDDHDLLLEKRKWQSEDAQLIREYRKALAGLDRAEIAILEAKRAQAEAQLDLIKQELARTDLVAPYAGLVVKGDLSQSLGSPVERGDVLFEVAPVDKYRVILKVDDRDIGLVARGQHGQLKLSGLPDQSIAVTINRLTPIATTEGGRNYFRVEAVMDAHSDLMRPGMQGIAKVAVGRAKLLWVWTRRLVDWLRLSAWNWMP